jgi:hypothetical protein
MMCIASNISLLMFVKIVENILDSLSRIGLNNRSGTSRAVYNSFTVVFEPLNWQQALSIIGKAFKSSLTNLVQAPLNAKVIRVVVWWEIGSWLSSTHVQGSACPPSGFC